MKTKFVVSGCSEGGEFFSKEVTARSAYEAATNVLGSSVLPDNTNHTKNYRHFETVLGKRVSVEQK